MRYAAELPNYKMDQENDGLGQIVAHQHELTMRYGELDLLVREQIHLWRERDDRWNCKEAQDDEWKAKVDGKLQMILEHLSLFGPPTFYSPLPAVHQPQLPQPPQTYGLPLSAYGPPSSAYGPPSSTYGPPPSTSGPPPSNSGPPPAFTNQLSSTFPPTSSSGHVPVFSHSPPTLPPSHTVAGDNFSRYLTPSLTDDLQVPMAEGCHPLQGGHPNWIPRLSYGFVLKTMRTCDTRYKRFGRK